MEFIILVRERGCDNWHLFTDITKCTYIKKTGRPWWICKNSFINSTSWKWKMRSQNISIKKTLELDEEMIQERVLQRWKKIFIFSGTTWISYCDLILIIYLWRSERLLFCYQASWPCHFTNWQTAAHRGRVVAPFIQNYSVAVRTKATRSVINWTPKHLLEMSLLNNFIRTSQSLLADLQR